jgi:predicted lipase
MNERNIYQELLEAREIIENMAHATNMDEINAARGDALSFLREYPDNDAAEVPQRLYRLEAE